MRYHTTIATLGAFVLALGLAGSARAASSVDITYDVSDTTFLNGTIRTCPDHDCTRADLLGGSMTVRYASNSASSMPIQSGPATLQSLTLQAHLVFGDTTNGLTTYLFSTASMNFQLTSPATGNLLSGGTLTFAGAQFRATGLRHCRIAYNNFCIVIGTLTSLVAQLGPFTSTATLGFAASPGSQGGAQSTRHTVSGTIPASIKGKWYYANGIPFLTGVNLAGREVLREAEGHDPKVTPEPGTLLLLGAGAAGLALVGRATRRSRD